MKARNHFFAWVFALLTCLPLQTYAEDVAESQPFADSTEWFPEGPYLFKPLIGDPRQVTVQGSLRFTDNTTSNRAAAVTFGQEFTLYRWKNVRRLGSDMELGLSIGVLTLFDREALGDDWMELVNADYFVGFPLTFAKGKWSHRFRLYHMSSHLGDEFIIAKPNVERKNPSVETIDFISSYHFSEALRVYGGAAYILLNDPSYPQHAASFEYGAEVRLFAWEDTANHTKLQPFFTMHLKHKEDHGWEANGSYRLGLEISRIDQEYGRKLRAFFELYDGHSQEGQLSKQETTFFSFNVSLGF